MATADPTICFTIPAHARQRFGTSTILCSLETPPVRPFGPAGASSRLEKKVERVVLNALASETSSDDHRLADKPIHLGCNYTRLRISLGRSASTPELAH